MVNKLTMPKHALCDIDPEDVHLLLHGTRLLWLNGFIDLELIVAHCNRSAQGRVHFITTVWRGNGLPVSPQPMLRKIKTQDLGKPHGLGTNVKIMIV